MATRSTPWQTASLTDTSKGQVTLRKELLAHLGVKPGQRIDVEALHGGRLQMATRQQPPGELGGVERGCQLLLERLVKITADTNVLVQDDPEQSRPACNLLEQAELIAITLRCCANWCGCGDFAHGVIAHGGRALGSKQLVTFDREGARLLPEAGEPVLLL